MAFLYEKIDALREYGSCAPVPDYIPQNLNPNFELRPYQRKAFENFITHFESRKCPKPTQVLFHMATGSGKTLMMAGLMLYLYQKGYRNFLFFVNLSNIVEKTRENFTNPASSKYLFAQDVVLEGCRVPIRQVENFQDASPDAINLCFTTTQGLHADLWTAKENAMSFEDFKAHKTVLISDEAHHLNVDTKKKRSAEEESSYHSWEQTVKAIFRQHAENVLLEFTATCDLANPAIRAAYEDKMITDYPLAKFYADRYSKDIITLRSDLSVMERALQALVLSQYRLKVFQDYRLSIKPVVLFKAAKIAESKAFFETFLEMVRTLTGARLQALADAANSAVMRRAFGYFADNGISMETLASELRDDFAAEHCISVNDDQDATQKQILLNSLEDVGNPYRAVFEVKKLDEGWDVLNLFDIVRLYETRQSSGSRISPATIAEAQLIGRGARYCPFQVEAEQPRFQRKYDEDVSNPLRICEELYYHCQNDHRYVTELKTALREIGLDTDQMVQREYTLKPAFRTDPLYTQGVLFVNDREVQDRRAVRELPDALRNTVYRYEAPAGTSGMDEIMRDTPGMTDTRSETKTTQWTIGEIAAIQYALVHKALMKYPVYRFQTLKRCFPNVASTREFITSAEYLGGIRLEIVSREARPSMTTLYRAVFSALGRIADSISGIEETYRGTRVFHPCRLQDVFGDKVVHYTRPHDGGVGVPQSDVSVNERDRLDLAGQDWFAYADNYGTSEEKAFVAHFYTYIDRFRQVYQKVVLIRNERMFHLYSFEEGKRFEPDYVLILQRETDGGLEQIQVLIEPKGNHLLAEDAWKEAFLLSLEQNSVAVGGEEDGCVRHRIVGLHFFNENTRKREFDQDLENLLKL